MSKLVLIPGEHVYVEFKASQGLLPEALMIEWSGRRAKVRVFSFENGKPEPIAEDTIFDVETTGDEEPNLVDALVAVFGDSVMVMDEHGIRKAKPEKND